MTEEEELGAAVTDALHRLVSDVEPSDRLREWVRTELRSPLPAPGPRERKKRWSLRRRVLAVLTPSTALVAIAVAIFAGTQATASFAVVQGPGGLIHITIDNIEGVSGADAKLRQLGLKMIVVVPVKVGCRSDVQLMFTGVGAAQGGAGVGIYWHQIPPHFTDVLAAKQISPGVIALGLGRVRGPAPSCVAPVTSGVGIPPQHPSTP